MDREYSKGKILAGMKNCFATDRCSSCCPYMDEQSGTGDCITELYLDTMALIDDLCNAANKEENDEMPDILPCPFCGGEGRLVHEGRVSYVVCISCRAKANTVEESTRYSSDRRAIKTWNRRS